MTTTAPVPYTPVIPSASEGYALRRLASVDVLRGVVMVLMALDHTRDFVSKLHFQPEDLTRSSAALFATRWITHFCAPSFCLLAGLGIGIAMNRGKRGWDMSRFLLTRGLWLIALDLVITAVFWRFSFNLFPMLALALWVLGLSMIVMAALVYLPKPVVAVIALTLIAGHNLFDTVQAAQLGAFGPWWTVLHVPGFAIPGKLVISYPLIPWVAVMALGWLLADVYRWDADRRRRFLLWTGLGAVALFLVLRGINGYGNTAPWAPQRIGALTVASFLNVRKYPPSLDFLLMTLGPALVALALLERARGRLADWIAVYGRVPLFYYSTHIIVAHLAGMAVMLAQGGGIRRITVVENPGALPAWFGLDLPGVYLAWLGVVLVMYFPCKWMAGLKERSKAPWLAYF
jgi:uncharacterized membrane protein